VCPSEQRGVHWVEVELVHLYLLIYQAMLPEALLVKGAQLLGQGTLDVFLLIRELTFLWGILRVRGNLPRGIETDGMGTGKGHARRGPSHQGSAHES
jgi:hypothetical protein